MSIVGAPPPGAKPGGGGGQKRKSDGSASGSGKPSGPTTKKGKKGPVTTSPDKDFIAKMESASPTFSMGSDEEDEDGKLVDKSETEEDKRKNFLERNRQGKYFHHLLSPSLLQVFCQSLEEDQDRADVCVLSRAEVSTEEKGVVE